MAYNCLFFLQRASTLYLHVTKILAEGALPVTVSTARWCNITKILGQQEPG